MCILIIFNIIIIFSLVESFKTILEATFTHSRNLAFFVFAYKGLTSLFRFLEDQKSQYHSFVAAFCAGFIVFGKYNKVNEQVSTVYKTIFLLYHLVKHFVLG